MMLPFLQSGICLCLLNKTVDLYRNARALGNMFMRHPGCLCVCVLQRGGIVLLPPYTACVSEGSFIVTETMKDVCRRLQSQDEVQYFHWESVLLIMHECIPSNLEELGIPLNLWSDIMVIWGDTCKCADPAGQTHPGRWSSAESGRNPGGGVPRVLQINYLWDTDRHAEWKRMKHPGCPAPGHVELINRSENE